MEEVIQVGKRIRKLRQDKGLTMKELARRAGISLSGLHKIETNGMVPTISMLMKIARAMEEEVSSFLEAGQDVDEVSFVRRQRRPKFYSSDSQTLNEYLTPRRDSRAEAGIFTIDSGGKSGDRPNSHHYHELIVCLKGKVKFVVGKRTYLLSRGDSISYPARLPHLWRNEGVDKAQLLWVSIRSDSNSPG